MIRGELISVSGARRLARMFLLSGLVGLLAGFAARGMEEALLFAVPRLIGRAVRPAEADRLRFRFDWRILALPVLGGLVSGVAVAFLCRPTRTHGNGVLIDAFHNRQGRMSVKDAAVKVAAAVGVISTGGSVGKEGPIAVLSASLGAAAARIFGLTPREVRLFLVAGTAGGIGAMFQCPLGGALFATTVLYRDPDIEADAVMPSLVASVVAYSTFMAFGGFGQHLLRGTEGLSFSRPAELLAYAAVGVACAVAAIVFYLSLHGAEKLRAKARIPAWLAPPLAGLAVGAVALVLPQVMDARYEFIQGCLAPGFATGALFLGLVVVAKCLATGAMIGTDTAGGLFGPVVFVGGAVGAASGALLEVFFPGSVPEPLRQAMIPVGMAGMLAASLRVPLAAVVMVMEMTGSYGLIVPLMLTSALAYGLGRRWGLYDVQVPTQEHSPAHVGKTVVGLLESWKVADMMDRSWPYVATAAHTLPQLVSAIGEGTRPSFVVLDGTRLLGVISTGDIARIAERGATEGILAMDVMTTEPVTLEPGGSLYDALTRFRESGQSALPVVEPDGTFAGMLTSDAIRQAVRKRIDSQRADLLREHADLAALDREGEIESLLSGLSRARKETVQRIPVPADAVGRSLREAEFRRRHGEVIAIETASGDVISPPDPERVLAADDRLVVLPKTGGTAQRTR